jgi:hypothetical protein
VEENEEEESIDRRKGVGVKQIIYRQAFSLPLTLHDFD